MHAHRAHQDQRLVQISKFCVTKVHRRNLRKESSPNNMPLPKELMKIF